MEAALRVLMVAIGGAAGATARYGLNLAAIALCGPRFPAGTLAANTLGCLLAGIALAFFEARAQLPPHYRLLVITGFLGGLTTLSALAMETLTFARDREVVLAAGGIVLNLALSLGGVWLGWAAARAALA